MGSVRRELQSLDGSFKIESMQTMQAFYSEAKVRRRFLMGTLSAFAGIAFTLAVVGIYGVIAFTVPEEAVTYPSFTWVRKVRELVAPFATFNTATISRVKPLPTA